MERAFMRLLLTTVLCIGLIPWQISAQGPERRIIKGDRSINAVAVAPRGALLATGHVNCEVRLYELLTGRVRSTLKGPNNYIYALAFSKDGKRLIAAGTQRDERSAARVVITWNVATGEELTGGLCLDGGGSILALSVHGDVMVTVAGYPNPIATAWDLGTAKKVVLKGHTGHVKLAAVSADGKRIATIGGRPHLIVWEFPSGKKLWEKEYDLSYIPRGLAFSPDGRSLLATGGITYLYDSTNGEKVAAWRGPAIQAQFSPDGRLIAFKRANTGILLWSAQQRKQLTVLRASGEGGMDKMAFSPDGMLVVTAGSRGIIRVWDVPQLLPGIFDGPLPKSKKK